MKKAKILTVLGVCLAMGIVACNKGNEEQPASQEAPASQPASEQSQAPSQQSQAQSSSSQQQSSEPPAPQKDATGHIWGADADVAGDAENGLAAYKRAVCTEEDNAVKYTVNQSVVKYDKGGRKSGTPEGYTKLNSNGDIMSFKFNTTKFLKGKLYLFGCMDGYSSNYTKNWCYYQSKPNVEIKVNGEVVDISAQSAVTFEQVFGQPNGGDNSDENYGLLGDIVLQKGVNEIIYKRVATLNILIKDFVFVGEEIENEWSEPVAVAKTATSVAYTKSTNNLNGSTKIEWKALDGTFADGSSNKDGTPEGFLKLKSNNHSISYALDFGADLDGQIYQRGAMDNYSSNQTRTYYSAQSGAKYGNFELIVNGSPAYFGDKKDVTYLDLLGEGSNPDTENMSGYSEVKDCLIGDAYIKNGANTISFKRLDSFNLAISDFVFIGKASAKAHVAPADTVEFTGKDDISHWKVVEGDSFKFNRGDHQWGADEANPDTESTCTVQGEKHYKCTVCGATKVEKLELKAHTWVSDEELASTDTESTCTTHGIAHMKCSVCGAKNNQELPLGEHTFASGTAVQNSDGKDVTPIECSVCHRKGYQMGLKDCFEGASDIASDGKVANGKVLKYRFKVGTDVGKVSFMMKAMCNSKSSRTGQLYDNPFSDGSDAAKGSYTLKAGDKVGTVTAAGKQLGADFGATEALAVWFEMGQVEFAAADVDANGEIVISIEFPATQDYRHKYQEGVRIVFLPAA